MKNFRYAALSNILCWPLFLAGQTPGGATDSLQILPEIVVQDIRFERTGYATWQADSLPQGNTLSLANRLLWENPASTRPNAPGTLSTLSTRGAGPSRTAVLWNGLNLQSPMHGMVDLSLTPIWASDHISLRYGGQSAALSSGAMGGAILIESDPLSAKKGIPVQLEISSGSFGRKEASGSLGGSNEKISSQIRGAWQQANNDFPFQNTFQIGQPKVRQQNNFLEKTDIQQFNRLIINAKNVLKTAAWHQNAFRQIPPTMTESATDTWQVDRSNRIVASWEHRPNNHSGWQARLAWLDEFIAYYYAGDTDTSRARTFLGSFEYSASQGRHLFWKMGANGAFQSAQADGYADSSRWFQQPKSAAFGMAEWQWRNGKVSVLTRQEVVDQVFMPITWSLGGQIKFGKPGEGLFHLSRNFNLPTLNDRYWNRLGKDDLLPESGYSADVGWRIQSGPFSTEVTAFQLILDNLIIWLPSGNDQQFRPGNLRKVHSRGAEWRGCWQTGSEGWNWKLSGRYQLVRATNVRVYAGAGDVLGRELPYTPRHSGGLTFLLKKNALSTAYLHQFTGRRFVTSDNRTALPGFQTGQLLLEYSLRIARKKGSARSLQVVVNARIENVWNTPYQVLAFRPMPGRAWSAGLVINSHP